ncbi:MAG: endolytic transglycosylase MltG [Propionibacteriales bacterium]|nr:endolytic transglycosylase MltG [Propionibacteriales bacterium]
MTDDDGSLARHRGRRRGRRRNTGCIAVFLSLAILVGVGVFAVVQGRVWLENLLAPPADFQGGGHGKVEIEVKDGDTAVDIGETLVRDGVVASVEAFTDEARDEPEARLIQAGFYDMKLEMSGKSALKRMLNPDSRVSTTVTIPEGLTVDQTLRTVVDGTALTMEDLRAVIRKPPQLGLPGYAKGRHEGYLFPATYEVTPGTDAKAMLTTMVDRFKQAAKSVRLERQAARGGISPAQAVIVASILEREVNRARDLPKAARVIYNRLNSGQRLQMDSTVHYAIGEYDSVATTAEQRRVDSRYNTYRYAGLPPGPISAPGEKALDAALNPADGEWRYFVTVNLETGETRFASTDRQHQRNVRVYQRYCQRSDLC